MARSDSPEANGDDMVPATASAHAMDLVGYHDLEGIPGFKLALQHTAERWYLYVTRFWESGIWILDVTDPAHPDIVGVVPSPEDPNVASWQVQVADGLLVQGLEHRPEPWGGDPSRATAEGLRLWDVTDPATPHLRGAIGFGAHGTHRSYYAGGNLLHATASVPGATGNIYLLLDVSDPSHPIERGRWSLPAQWEPDRPTDQRISLHGPPYPDGDLVYLPYGRAGMIVLDIADPSHPSEIGRLEQGPAFSSAIAMHTVVPLPDRDLAVVNTEAIAERSEEAYNFAGIVSVGDPATPRLLSLLPPPLVHPGADYPNFQRRGGRFGPHNQHHPQGQPHHLDEDTLVYLTWFNAGLRVYDIGDPYVPREVGHYLPADPVERRGPLPRSALVTQSEDVLVDARGYAYLTDKNHGLHILRFTG